MKVLVTGASGFVGRRLMPRLQSAGHETIGVDREVDVTDPEAIASSLRDYLPDAIVHLAAMSSVAESGREPEACYRINFCGTRNLLRAAADTCPDARLILVGSTDQYGATAPREREFDEATPLRPRSPYARTKAAAELLGQEAAAKGQDVVRIRASNHTGAGQPDHFVVSSFARQLAAIRCGEQEPVMRVGNLESVRDFLHVDDVVDAYLTLLDSGVPADVYNVASGHAVPIHDILDRLIARAQISPRVEIDPDRFRPTDWCVADASKLRRTSGWRPQRSLDDLLGELYEDWLTKRGIA